MEKRLEIRVPVPKVKMTACLHRILGGAGLALLAACGPAKIPSEINDPHEAQNRQIHAVNRTLDRAILRPTAKAYGFVIPDPVKMGVANFASNLDLPGETVNGLLQGRPEDAAHNGVRFVINSTLGLAGLFDPAAKMGLPGISTDFGETMHVWGFPEGAFVELPLLGPGTSRDTMGKIVDVVANPVGTLLSWPERDMVRAVSLASRIGDRYTYLGMIDAILYESADSYAQSRLMLLQNRRYQLGRGATVEADVFDPYEDMQW